MANAKIELPKRILGIGLFAACLAMIFEADIRNIGHLEIDPVGSIALLPKFYLSDLGMILPIFLAVLAFLPKLLFPRKRVLFFLIFSFFYGMTIWLISNNPVQDIGGDIRVFLALFSGLSLVALLPNNHKALPTSITVISTAGLLIGTIILFTIPDTDFLSVFQRTTHPSAFSLLGLPLAFIGPSIIYSSLIGDRKLTVLSWFNAGMFLMITILIVQTRSFFLTALIGIVFALITIFVLSSQSKRRSGKDNRLKIPWMGVIFCIVFVAAIFYWLSVYSDVFLTRLAGLSAFQEDPGITPRLLEIPTIFESMSISDHIFGVGLSPVPILTAWDGTPYNASHIGILNVWWRLGFPIFLIMICMFIVLMARWAKNLAYLYFHPSKNKITAEIFGLMVCWSGVASIFFISCMSGGWSASTMLPLGLLWGVYRRSGRIFDAYLTERKKARFFQVAKNRRLTPNPSSAVPQ